MHYATFRKVCKLPQEALRICPWLSLETQPVGLMCLSRLISLAIMRTRICTSHDKVFTSFTCFMPSVIGYKLNALSPSFSVYLFRHRITLSFQLSDKVLHSCTMNGIGTAGLEPARVATPILRLPIPPRSEQSKQDSNLRIAASKTVALPLGDWTI